jgi:hypothetical protein
MGDSDQFESKSTFLHGVRSDFLQILNVSYRVQTCSQILYVAYSAQTCSQILFPAQTCSQRCSTSMADSSSRKNLLLEFDDVSDAEVVAQSLEAFSQMSQEKEAIFEPLDAMLLTRGLKFIAWFLDGPSSGARGRNSCLFAPLVLRVLSANVQGSTGSNAAHETCARHSPIARRTASNNMLRSICQWHKHIWPRRGNGRSVWYHLIAKGSTRSLYSAGVPMLLCFVDRLRRSQGREQTI